MNKFAKVELKYIPTENPLLKVQQSSDIYKHAKRFFNPDTISLREEFKIFFLNRANYISGYFDVSLGGIAGTIVDLRMIFQAALLHNSSSLILSHNHPSNNAKPSEADIKITKKIKEAGNIMDIPVLDHIILTVDSYYSFADEGIL